MTWGARVVVGQAAVVVLSVSLSALVLLALDAFLGGERTCSSCRRARDEARRLHPSAQPAPHLRAVPDQGSDSRA